MIQKAPLVERVQTLVKEIGSTCDDYAAVDSGSGMHLAWLALAKERRRSSQPGDVRLILVAVFYSPVERASYSDTLHVSSELETELSSKSSLPLWIEGYAYDSFTEQHPGAMEWSVMLGLLRGHTIWIDPNAQLEIPRMAAKKLWEDGRRRVYEAERIFKETIAMLPPSRDEFFSPTYTMRPTVCRNVLDIIDLVDFELDHPFSGRAVGTFTFVYYLRTTGNDTFRWSGFPGPLKQLEPGWDVNPESVVDLEWVREIMQGIRLSIEEGFLEFRAVIEGAFPEDSRRKLESDSASE